MTWDEVFQRALQDVMHDMQEAQRGLPIFARWWSLTPEELANLERVNDASFLKDMGIEPLDS